MVPQGLKACRGFASGGSVGRTTEINKKQFTTFAAVIRRLRNSMCEQAHSIKGARAVL